MRTDGALEPASIISLARLEVCIYSSEASLRCSKTRPARKIKAHCMYVFDDVVEDCWGRRRNSLVMEKWAAFTLEGVAGAAQKLLFNLPIFNVIGVNDRCRACNSAVKAQIKYKKIRILILDIG